MLSLIPKIIEANEQIESVSLGAGNTGRPFDLETDRRVAEFKFIHWRGGAESIRQNNLFKDYFLLAEHETAKRKELYVLGTRYPIKFLSSGRSLKSILSKNSKVADEYFAIYGDRFKTVGDYFGFRCDAVAIGDAALLIPELVVKALEVAANSPE